MAARRFVDAELLTAPKLNDLSDSIDANTAAVATEAEARATGDADRVEKAGDTMTGWLTISLEAPRLILKKPASGSNITVLGQTGTANRWSATFGDSTAESGSNVGSDFTLDRYNDAGTYIDSPLSIKRSTGVLTLSTSMVIGGSGGPKVLSGSGTPESAVTAPVGSVYLRTDGSTSTTLYVKTSGTGNTGWTAK